MDSVISVVAFDVSVSIMRGYSFVQKHFRVITSLINSSSYCGKCIMISVCLLLLGIVFQFLSMIYDDMHQIFGLFVFFWITSISTLLLSIFALEKSVQIILKRTYSNIPLLLQNINIRNVCLQGLVHVARKMPKNGHAHFILGLMYQRLGQPQKVAFETVELCAWINLLASPTLFSYGNTIGNFGI